MQVKQKLSSKIKKMILICIIVDKIYSSIIGSFIDLIIFFYITIPYTGDNDF